MSAGSQFNADLSAWANKAQAKLDGLVRQTCQEISENTVKDTPVDTGFLRGSWQPSIGAPAAAKGALDQSGAKALADIGLVVSGVKAGDRFFLVNNAAYARRLEYGFVGEDSLGRTYNQQGRFFVTRNVKRWPLIVRRMAKVLGI
jgi:hypothetical protein